MVADLGMQEGQLLEPALGGENAKQQSSKSEKLGGHKETQGDRMSPVSVHEWGVS